MPRIEFESEDQRERFNSWLKGKFDDKRVDLIGENSRGHSKYPARSLEVLEIDDEPIHIEIERKKMARRKIAIKLGEGKIWNELKDAGVIFEKEETLAPDSSWEDEVRTTEEDTGHLFGIPRRPY